MLCKNCIEKFNLLCTCHIHGCLTCCSYHSYTEQYGCFYGANKLEMTHYNRCAKCGGEIDECEIFFGYPSSKTYIDDFGYHNEEERGF
jgi:hypothetical protein